MKKLLIGVGGLAVAAVTAILVLPALVPVDTVKNQVVAQVKSATGRDLAIGGKVSVSALPSVGVAVTDVTLSNPPGFSSKHVLRLGALDVKLKLLPLLSGAVEIDSFVLVDPVITVETDKKGRSNLDFGTGEPAEPGKSEPASGGIADLRLGTVAIRNGKLAIINGAAGTKEEFTDLNLTVDMDSLDSPLAAKGGLKWRGQSLDLALDVAKPRALMDGKASAASLALSGKPVKVSFRGEADKAGAKGDLDVAVPSVRDLVQWTTGQPLALSGSGAGPFAVKGKLAAGNGKVALTKSTITLDAIKAAGDFTVTTSGARPALRGKLAVETLDLNPYLPPADTAASSGKTTAAAKSDWSDAPIDASGLKAADVDFDLAVNAIKMREIDIGKSVLHLTLANGLLTADLSELHLYQGSGKGRVSLDGRHAGLGLDATFALKGLQAAPFLKAAAGFDRIEGTGSADITVSGRGGSERQLVQSLNGKGAVTFLDGAIKGVNLAAMMRNVTSAFSETSGSQKTDFSELSGTYTIAGGIATNKDLTMKSPLLRMEGDGTVDLPKRTVNYRVEPKVVASLEGQGGKGDLGGITVPVIIEGPWDNLSYRPDLGGAVKGKAEKILQNVGGGKLPTASQPTSADQTQPQQQSPALPIKPGNPLGR